MAGCENLDDHIRNDSWEKGIVGSMLCGQSLALIQTLWLSLEEIVSSFQCLMMRRQIRLWTIMLALGILNLANHVQSHSALSSYTILHSESYISDIF